MNDLSNKYLRIAINATEGAAQVVKPGGTLIEYLPLLRHVPTWVPGASVQRKIPGWRRAALELRDAPWEACRTTQVGSIIRLSLLRRMMVTI